MDKTLKMEQPLEFKIIPRVCSFCNKVYKLEKLRVGDNTRISTLVDICPECLLKHNNMICPCCER